VGSILETRFLLLSDWGFKLVFDFYLREPVLLFDFGFNIP